MQVCEQNLELLQYAKRNNRGMEDGNWDAMAHLGYDLRNTV